MDHPFDLPDDFDFAQLGRDYETGRYTIDELCEKWNLSRDTFLAIRKAAPQTWTKRGPNYWWDELDEDADELAEKAADRAKAAKAKKKAQQKKSREDEKAARKWYELEDALDEAAEKFSEWHAAYNPPEFRVRVGAHRKLNESALLLPVHDLHYGKYATEEETGADYDRDVAENRAHEAVDQVLTQAARTAHIEEIHAVCGTSDFLHIDQDSPPRTTAGTPQDADGTIGEIIAGGQALAVELIDKMRAVAPTKVHYAPGNHDRVASQWMHSFLQAHFSGAAGVTFTEDRRTRQYWEYGVTKGCFFHGDVRKSQLKELGNTIAREHGFGEYTMAISGHKHFRKADDKSGLLMHQTPSLSGSDRWHDRNLYTGLPGLQAFVLDRERGPVSTPTWYV